MIASPENVPEHPNAFGALSFSMDTEQETRQQNQTPLLVLNSPDCQSASLILPWHLCGGKMGPAELGAQAHPPGDDDDNKQFSSGFGELQQPFCLERNHCRIYIIFKLRTRKAKPVLMG